MLSSRPSVSKPGSLSTERHVIKLSIRQVRNTHSRPSWPLEMATARKRGEQKGTFRFRRRGISLASPCQPHFLMDPLHAESLLFCFSLRVSDISYLSGSLSVWIATVSSKNTARKKVKKSRKQVVATYFSTLLTEGAVSHQAEGRS